MGNDVNERIQRVLEMAQTLFTEKESKIKMTAVYYGGKSERKVDLRQLNKHLYINGNFLDSGN